MSFHKNTRKEDLINVLKEIGEQATSKETIIELKTKLEKSAAFKEDPDFVINLLNLSVEDRQAKAERQLQETNSQLELEKIKLQQIEREIELQKALAEGQATQQSSKGHTINLENLIKSVKTLTIQIPTKTENFGLFFQSLERSFRVKNVPENLKAEILINILGERAHNVLLYIKDDEIKEYDLVKSLILREFQPTAQECLLNFRKAKRQADETHVQFATRLSAMFKYYLKIRNVVDFKSLVDLMISDKFLDTLEPETASHIKIMQADQWMTPDELGKACDIFFISKNRSLHDSRNPNTFKSKNDDVYSKNRANMGDTNQFQRKFPKHNQSIRADKTVSCYICGGPHFARNCTKKTMNSEKRNTLDSGANSVIINSKYVSEGKRIHSQIVLTSCFGEKRSANVSEFTISLKGGEKKKILAAVCRIEAAILLPSKVFEFLKSGSGEAESTNASCTPVCLQNETGGEIDVDLTGGVTNSGKITDGSNLFLLKVSETFDECLYDVSHISNSGIRDKVQTLIENYCPNKTETTALKMKIILSDEKPIAQRSRRLSLPEKREVEKQIDEWLEQGIIRESRSDFSSPVVVCKKKDGTMRLCIDYRKLNKKIVKDRYPLPIIEEVLDKLGNGKIFTTLDLKNAFFHVDVDEASRKYTAFVTETGQYEFLKVPSGLSISSNYFQRYINYVFRELLRDGTLIIYLDDIIIPATDEKEACQKLARVLETASRYGIELNLKKCQFLQGKINF
ncbi:retrovirus-related Pol polyprotein from transposon 297 [Trichonephila clavipes]|uniref:Retrovirus-related Pol polyprotein from transposon 297 n=1 Tax=Trichonephila clavipes TaxID=2585209 RepID=A0A8X6S654_TRICX|nr:retrovirus-related Pol polyprotein from transposon 297 [Trichonephila clavipes]